MHTHSTTDDPAAIVFVSLKNQAERLGYVVAVWTGDPVFAAPVEVDHEAQTVAVDGDADPASVIPTLTAVVAAIQLRAQPLTRGGAPVDSRRAPSREMGSHAVPRLRASSPQPRAAAREWPALPRRSMTDTIRAVLRPQKEPTGVGAVSAGFLPSWRLHHGPTRLARNHPT
jgi:hypothetical protein